MVCRRPFTPAGQVQFRLSNGDRVAIPTPLHFRESTNSSHTFGFRWESIVLEFSVDDNCIATMPLTMEQSIEPWALNPKRRQWRKPGFDAADRVVHKSGCSMRLLA